MRIDGSKRDAGALVRLIGTQAGDPCGGSREGTPERFHLADVAACLPGRDRGVKSVDALDPKRGGFLEFGTELVAAADHSLVALLGASPGASTAVFIAIGVLEKCFKNELTANAWLPKLKQMIPSYGESLIEDAALTRRIRADTAAVLHLENV
jgi:hypothetical protein